MTTGKETDARRTTPEEGAPESGRTERPSRQEADVTIEAGRAAVRFEAGSELVPTALVSIQRIGPFNAAKLATANIRTTEDLLALCADDEGRRVVSDMTGLAPARLLEWARFVELMSLDGLVAPYAELLLACGVRTVGDLTARSAAGLADAMMEVNAASRITELVPSEAVIDGWIRQAARREPGVRE